MPRRPSSIRRKLMVTNALISGTALLVAGVAFGAYDQGRVREAMVRNLSIQAQIVAANSVAALMFDDSPTAEVTLSALSATPRITSAAIFTPDDRVFATYALDPGVDATMVAPAIPRDAVEIHHFDERSLMLARRITLDGKEAGRVLIRSDLQELATRRNQYIGIITAVLVPALLAALLLSWYTQRAIAHPVKALAAIARTVSVEKDYAVRAAVPTTVAEIGVLTSAFNEMLAQIQERDKSLGEAQNALEERVRQRTAELDAVNKELEAFSYSVSHDLRAPLRHVVGFATLLREQIKDRVDERSNRYLETITAAATKMGQLIDDLLTFSRMGRSQLVSQRVSLSEVAREAREEVISHNGVASRTIDWQLSDLPDVHGDPAMLRLVMVNLLSNAVKYTATRQSARIEVGNNGGPNEVVVYVRDNGVGFDMQYAGKLFGVFQRLHRAEEFEGTGVGLANVSRIIRRHGGRVWAEAQVDQGATFYFSLPRRQSLIPDP